MAEVDVAGSPVFCSDCFCERCMRGFFNAGRQGIRMPGTGEWRCPLSGCTGTLWVLPTLSWKRLSACKDGCARTRQLLRSA